MSLSSGSCGFGRNRRNEESIQRPVKSCIPSVIHKLKSHPEYRDRAYNNELRQVAEDITERERIMVEYFSTITYNLVEEKIRECDEDGHKELLTSYDRRRHIHKSMFRVEDVAKFHVKLLLRPVDRRRATPKVVGKIAAALQMEYGPLHAALLINNEILLEWNSSSLVLPQLTPIEENTRVLVAATVRGHDAIEQCRLSKPYSSYDEMDLIFDAASKKLELISKLAKVIALYNSLYYYDVIFRNCQHFVLDCLQAIGCKNTPQFDGKLKEYFEHLKQKGRVKADFHTHKELDDYVQQNISTLTQANMEYLLAQYYILFHMESIAKCKRPETWQCSHPGCMMHFLEHKINEKELIMNRYFNHQLTV